MVLGRGTDGPGDVRAAMPTRPRLIATLLNGRGNADIGSTGGQSIPPPASDASDRRGVPFPNRDGAYPVGAPSRGGCSTGCDEPRFAVSRLRRPGGVFFPTPRAVLRVRAPANDQRIMKSVQRRATAEQARGTAARPVSPAGRGPGRAANR